MKKVLSFVLILALVLGSFSFAFGLSDIEDSAKKDAINVCNDLGIITGYTDGSFKPEQAVNRAEFAAMITRAMAVPESALAAYSATSFKDTSGYGWAIPYLAFCESKGIMIGDGQGNAMPGRTININEAITMVARTIGYTENSSVLVGSWPANYVTLAQDLGLYDSLSTATTIDRANAAQVIYNGLSVNKVQVNADGKTEAIVPNVTMFDALGVTRTVVGGDGFKVLTKADADAAAINIYKFVGAYVKPYENKDGEIVAIAEVGSTFLTGTLNLAKDTFKAGGVTYNFDGTTTYYNNGAATLSNALYATNGAIAAVSQGAIGVAADYTIAAKVSGKTIKEVYSVQSWFGEEAFLFEADLLDDDSLNGYAFTLNDDDEIDMDSFALLGAASLDAIPEDAVVSIYLETPYDSTKKIVKVEVGTDTITGQVTKVDGSEYTIAGTVYKIAENANVTTIALGDEGTAYLDYNGKVAFWDEDTSATENYAMVTGQYATGARDSSVILLDKAGVEAEYFFTSTASKTSIAGMTVGDLVIFELNSAGKATNVSEVAVSAGGGADQLNASRTIYNNMKVDSGVVVFVWDGSDYTLGKIADVKAETNLSATYAAVDGKVKVLIVTDSVAGADAVYAVLNSAVNAINADGDTVDFVKGLAGGKAYEAYTSSKDLLKGSANVTNTSIKIVKLTVNSDGVIVNQAATTGNLGSATGYVVTKDSNTLVHIGNTSSAGVTWAAIDANAVVYEFDATESTWYKAGSMSTVKGKTAVATGTSIALYQLDDDSEVYDLVVIIK